MAYGETRHGKYGSFTPAAGTQRTGPSAPTHTLQGRKPWWPQGSQKPMPGGPGSHTSYTPGSRGSTTSDRLEAQRYKQLGQQQANRQPSAGPQPGGGTPQEQVQRYNQAMGRNAQTQPQPRQPAQRTQDQLVQEFEAWQRAGREEEWLSNPQNLQDLDRLGGRYDPSGGQRQRTNTMTMGGRAPGEINRGRALTDMSNINFNMIDAFQNNPWMRAMMVQSGMVPTVNGIPFDPNTGAPPSMRMNTRTGQWDRTGGPALTGGRAGYGAPMAAPPPQMAMGGGQPGMGMGGMGGGMGGGGGGMGSPVYGLGEAQASRLANQVVGGISGAIANPIGLPTQELYGQAQDALGAESRRAEDAIRENFARRGQTGSPAEQAALQAASQESMMARLGEFRDISAQDASQRAQRQLQALQMGAGLLKDERDLADRQFGRQLDFLQGVYT